MNYKNTIILVTFLFISILGHTQSIKINKDIQLHLITDSIFVHVTWDHAPKYGRFPSNGMLFIKNGKALMIDTPANDTQTQQLCQYLKDSMQVEVTQLIVGHFHNDCLGGLNYLKNKDIPSLSNIRTKRLCKKHDLPLTSHFFNRKKKIQFQGEELECRYFGGGHTEDNITVWFPKRQILFGGCLIKSGRSKSLGNIADAVVSDWDKTILKLQKHYLHIKTVIPGHGPYGNSTLLNHTIQLVTQFKQKNKKQK
ncbi:subclass B1 metallo-beta-lactamase [Prolixibacteraceae bacterium JC049]|nr:subclass B1 metallo-beta-lactamase [Prolixibacteraceae bacterium JC049]